MHIWSGLMFVSNIIGGIAVLNPSALEFVYL